jgi:hypothetical protein
MRVAAPAWKTGRTHKSPTSSKLAMLLRPSNYPRKIALASKALRSARRSAPFD